AVIRSTFLVGFPGETAREFEELLEFQEKAAIDWLGVFTYSREEDTPAYKMRGQLFHKLSEPLARKRKTILEESQIPLTEKRLDRFVGRELRVLIEEEIPGDGMFLGRGYLHAPEVDGLVVVHGEGLKAGERVLCRIKGRNGIDLEGETLLTSSSLSSIIFR
ncbi:MAG: 30S ribosomal protein S12 methylthiotransferase RimO, partial [Spirochaetota bacterium]